MSDDAPGTGQGVTKLGPRSKVRASVMLAMTIAGLALCLLLPVPFLPALTWALALAILFVPAHGAVEGRVANRNLAAAISVTGICLVAVVPMLLVGHRLVLEAIKGAGTMKERFQ